jgi:regulator of cell morphogenesis and NO signaling
VLEGKAEFVGTDRKENAMNKTPEARGDKELANAFRPEETVGALVTRLPALRPALERLGLDYCCGGKKPLGLAAKDAGLDWERVREELSRDLAHPTPAPAKNWAAAPVTALADHILDTNHVFTRSQLAGIDRLLAKVQYAHHGNHGVMLDGLRTIFDALRADLESHLAKEEQILFPAIKAIDGFLAGRNARPAVPCGSVAHPIRQMESEHDAAGGMLDEMRKITGGYRLPDDACPTFKSLYEALEALEADLHEHIHLENNILFPRSMRQEAEMGRFGA